jgi:hypothetical protein
MAGDDVRRLGDRLDIIELFAEYCRAFFYFDAVAYAGTAMEDGRYMNANQGWVAFGRTEMSAGLEGIPAGGGYQHLTTDHIIAFDSDDRAVARCNMVIYKRESAEGPNAWWGSGYYYGTVVRTDEGWRFSEIVSFLDQRSDDYVQSSLRGIVFARPRIAAAMTGLLGVGEDELAAHIQACRPVVALAAAKGVSEDDVVDALATALQESAFETNPLPRSSARAMAHILTHDEVHGVDVEANFRRAGWTGPELQRSAGSNSSPTSSMSSRS